MRERAISFNAPMSLQVHRGLKTQTRSPVKPQLPDEPTKLGGKRWGLLDGDFWYCGVRSPFGAPGDRLWVREPARLIERAASGALIGYEADGALNIVHWPKRLQPLAIGRGLPNGCYREASRITLEVERVWVERVRDISEEDARAEGVRGLCLQKEQPGAWWTADVSAGPRLHGRNARAAYRMLWFKRVEEEVRRG